MLRAWSTLLQAVTVIGTYALARLTFLGRRAVGLVAMAVVAFNPQFLLVASGVNNDNLITPLVTIGLYLLLCTWRDGLSVRRTVSLGILVGINGGLQYSPPAPIMELSRQVDGLAIQTDALIQDLEGLRARLDNLEGLSGRIGEVEARASRRDELSEEIGTIRGAVQQARRDDKVERLFAESSAARAVLEERLEEKLRGAAGACLLDSVREDYDRESRPEVLNRAGELFGRFTSHEYRLLFDSRGERPAFRAVETSSRQGKDLAALSEGTRIQLLLAARLAFATRADRGRNLPFFLDEVLTTSDPQRFAAAHIFLSA